MKNLLPIILLIVFASAASAQTVPSPSTASQENVSLELFFQRPARLLSGPGFDQKVVVEEKPFIEQADFNSATVVEREGRFSLVLVFTPEGRRKFLEARYGNVGRTVILAVAGEARKSFKLGPQVRGSGLELDGDFTTRLEAEKIAGGINLNYTPTPVSQPSPSPGPERLSPASS